MEKVMAKGNRGGQRTRGNKKKQPTRYKAIENGYFGQLKASDLKVGDTLPRNYLKNKDVTIDYGDGVKLKTKLKGDDVVITGIRTGNKQTKIQGYYVTHKTITGEEKGKLPISATFKNDEEVLIRLKGFN